MGGNRLTPGPKWRQTADANLREGLVATTEGVLRAHPVVEHRPHLGLTLESGPVLAVQLHELGCNPDCFGFRVCIQDCPATDDLLAFRERAVRHSDRATREPYANAIAAW
jgi:hypothetical protein